MEELLRQLTALLLRPGRTRTSARFERYGDDALLAAMPPALPGPLQAPLPPTLPGPLQASLPAALPARLPAPLQAADLRPS